MHTNPIPFKVQLNMKLRLYNIRSHGWWSLVVYYNITWRTCHGLPSFRLYCTGYPLRGWSSYILIAADTGQQKSKIFPCGARTHKSVSDDTTHGTASPRRGDTTRLRSTTLSMVSFCECSGVRFHYATTLIWNCVIVLYQTEINCPRQPIDQLSGYDLA